MYPETISDLGTWCRKHRLGMTINSFAGNWRCTLVPKGAGGMAVAGEGEDLQAAVLDAISLWEQTTGKKAW